MKKQSRYILLSAAVAAFLSIPAALPAMQAGAATQATDSQTKPAKSGKGKSTADRQPTAKPSSQEIADAKAKGLVWVNLGTGVYHKDGEFYGNTKRGKFMTEDEANKAGYHVAKEPGTSKKSPMKGGGNKPTKTT